MNYNKNLAKKQRFGKVLADLKSKGEIKAEKLTAKKEKIIIWKIEVKNKKSSTYLVVLDKKLNVLEVQRTPAKKVKSEAQYMLNFYNIQRVFFKYPRSVFKGYLLLYSAFAFLDTYLRDNNIVKEDKQGKWILKDEYKKDHRYIAIKSICIDLNYIFAMHKSFEFVDFLKQEVSKIFLKIPEERWSKLNTIYIALSLLIRYDELHKKTTPFRIERYSNFIANLIDEVTPGENDDFIADEIFSIIYPEKRIMKADEVHTFFAKLKESKWMI